MSSAEFNINITETKSVQLAFQYDISTHEKTYADYNGAINDLVLWVNWLGQNLPLEFVTIRTFPHNLGSDQIIDLISLTDQKLFDLGWIRVNIDIPEIKNRLSHDDLTNQCADNNYFVWIKSAEIKSLAWLGKPVAAPDQRFVSMQNLGNKNDGRFGSQIMEWVFLRLYALRTNAHIYTPDWMGKNIVRDTNVFETLPPPHQKIWLNRDPAIRNLPSWWNTDNGNGIWHFDPPPVNIDLRGEGSFLGLTEQIFILHKNLIHLMLQPRIEFSSPIDRWLDENLPANSTRIGVHVRRTDFRSWHNKRITPIKWYLNTLRDIWPDLENPHMILCTDEPEEICREFAEFKPILLPPELAPPGYEFYPDFRALGMCHILFVAGLSWYSLMAARAGRPDIHAFLPVPASQNFMSFDIWTPDPPVSALDFDYWAA